MWSSVLLPSPAARASSGVMSRPVCALSVRRLLRYSRWKTCAGIAAPPTVATDVSVVPLKTSAMPQMPKLSASAPRKKDETHDFATFRIAWSMRPSSIVHRKAADDRDGGKEQQANRGLSRRGLHAPIDRRKLENAWAGGRVERDRGA